MFTYLPERSKAAAGEHAHLIELLEGGDPDEIERYARWHKLQTVAAYRATREPPGYLPGVTPARARPRRCAAR
jgi:DNA-binding GntR family transcriptional regulator